MKKSTLLLLGLAIFQPLLVFFLQGLLVSAVPVHFGLTPDMWNLTGNHNLTIALFESILMPVLILAFRALPASTFPGTLPWLLSPRTVWLWWLFGMNWFILLSLFSAAAWISWSWQIWTGLCGSQLVIYIGTRLWFNHQHPA